jgi:para-aminobenzoate synthetase component 1
MTSSISIPYHANPEHYFTQLCDLTDFMWLDSGRPQSSQGRYDIFSALAIDHAIVGPTGEFSCKNNDHPNLDSWLAYFTRRPIAAETINPDLPFTGGVMGYFGYHWQHPPFSLPKGHNHLAPIVHLAAYNWALVVDHHNRIATLVTEAGCSFKQALIARLSLSSSFAPTTGFSSIDNDPSRTGKFQCSEFTNDTHKDDYLQAIRVIDQHILAGDCYQVNFSQRFSATYSGDLDTAYLRLRNATPSPYSAYIKQSDFSILSVSPERFLHVDGQHVMTQPIKGSCPRGQSSDEDNALATALQNSEKNRAENVMIVDLLRNDLSQCCKLFSVKVPRLCELHSFANVHHLVSTVIGELREGISAFELFKRSFPGGSITGAPKKRAMEIINELEKNDRGVYCGSVAYFSNNGRADSSIAIRTLQAEGGKLYCWGGGGIVTDSDAEEEYQESLFKVVKLMKALTHNPSQ